MPVSSAKIAYAERMNSLFDEYERVLFVGIDNVRSQQIHKVRKDLIGKGVLFMGKNTLQRRILANRAVNDSKTSEMIEIFNRQSVLTGNRGMIFTNAPISEINEILSRHRIQAPARVGAVSPCDVVIPAGNTGMEPTQTSFFQALSIQTKISKGTVEITASKKVLSPGDKVDNSTAVLLQKLKISPFFYEVEVDYVWDCGILMTSEDLAITDESLEQEMLSGISQLNALSLGAGIPIDSTFPQFIIDGFKDLLAISLETDYSFDEYNGAILKENILSGKFAATTAAPTATVESTAPPVVEEEDEEEDDFGMGGLF